MKKPQSVRPGARLRPRLVPPPRSDDSPKRVGPKIEKAKVSSLEAARQRTSAIAAPSTPSEGRVMPTPEASGPPSLATLADLLSEIRDAILGLREDFSAMISMAGGEDGEVEEDDPESSTGSTYSDHDSVEGEDGEDGEDGEVEEDPESSTGS